MNSVVRNISEGVKHMLFPHVCEICGNQLAERVSFICENCLSTKFQKVHNQFNSSSTTLMPEIVSAHYSMWKFDKGGYLQDLLHKLKYHYLFEIGVDLGKQLGKYLKENDAFDPDENTLIVPVPLHYRKERKRGYNQARAIAIGVSKVTSIPVVEKNAVIRIKNTKTQTGFTLSKRNENIRRAFKVLNEEVIQGKDCIIIDDVFTTGATTFELASCLKDADCTNICIATVALA